MSRWEACRQRWPCAAWLAAGPPRRRRRRTSQRDGRDAELHPKHVAVLVQGHHLARRVQDARHAAGGVVAQVAWGWGGAGVCNAGSGMNGWAGGKQAAERSSHGLRAAGSPQTSQPTAPPATTHCRAAPRRGWAAQQLGRGRGGSQAVRDSKGWQAAAHPPGRSLAGACTHPLTPPSGWAPPAAATHHDLHHVAALQLSAAVAKEAQEGGVHVLHQPLQVDHAHRIRRPET